MLNEDMHGTKVLRSSTVVGEIRAKAAVTQQNLRLEHVITGDGGAGTITTSDITALPGRTNLLGVARNATNRDINVAPLNREAGDARGKQGFTFSDGSTTEFA